MEALPPVTDGDTPSSAGAPRFDDPQVEQSIHLHLVGAHPSGGWSGNSYSLTSASPGSSEPGLAGPRSSCFPRSIPVCQSSKRKDRNRKKLKRKDAAKELNDGRMVHKFPPT